MVEAFGTITAYQDTINEHYHLREFVGRRWLIEEVSRFRNDKDRRSLIIVGEPGSGKSTFLAYLAELWNCPRHFIRMDNIGGVIGVSSHAFLISLGSQLYEKYGPAIFEHGLAGYTRVTVGWTKDQAEVLGRFVEFLYKLPFLPPQRDDVQVNVGVATGNSKVTGERIKYQVDVTLGLNDLTLLHATLIDPLHKIQELYPSESVMILVDALDESMQHAETSILDVLPWSADAPFPLNLRLLMTSRNGNHLSRFHSTELLHLDDKTKGYWQANQQDIQSYIRKRLAEAPFAGAIATWKREEVDDYVAQVVEHSQNNFLYIYHFFYELATIVEINDTNLRSFGIPEGLNEIYRSFAVEKIRRNMESTIHITTAEKIPLPLLARLKSIPKVSVVEIIDQDINLTTTDSDQVTSILFSILRPEEVQVTKFQTRKAEQIGNWEEKYLPVLGIMAVAYEPLGRELIAGFAGVEVFYVDSVLAQLKQFLDEIVYEQTNAYQFYHTSFSEYLLDSQRNRDYPLDALAYHYQVVSYYRGESTSWNEVAWSTIKESYPFNYLVAHLAASGHGEEVHRLLASETKQQRNTWFEVKEARGNVTGYLVDVNQAWKLAEVSGALIQSTQERRQTIVRQCRYALIIASINSRAENIPSVLLKTLVDKGVWTPVQGLAYTRQIPNKEQWARVLVELAPHLPAPLLQEALATAQAIADEGVRAWTLAKLAPRLGELGYGEEALEAIQTITDEHQRVEALEGLAPHLPTPLLRDALETAQAIADELERAWALAGLVPHLPTPLLRDALETAQAIVNEYLRAWPLAKLAPRLGELGYGEEALEVIQAIADEQERAWALVGLAPHLPLPLLQEALATAQAIASEDERARALMGLAPHLPASQQATVWQEVLATAQAIADKSNQAEALTRLAPHLPASLQVTVLQEALAAAQAAHPFWRTLTLAKLVPQLPAPLLQEALATAQAIASEDERARALMGLAPHLPASQQATVWQEVLATAQAIADKNKRVSALMGLAPHLPASQQATVWQEALAVAQAIADKNKRAEVLTELALHLPASLQVTVLQEALAVVYAIGDEHQRAWALVGLAPHLPTPLLQEALAATQAIEYEGERAEVLARLVPYLPASLLQEALAAAQALTDEHKRAEALTRLAPHLPVSLLQEALAVAETLADKYRRAEELMGLAPHLPASQQATVWQEALAVAQAIEYERERTLPLAKLAPRLGELGYGGDALAVAQTITYEFRRAQALAELAPYLPAPLLREALAVAQAIADKGTRAQALAGLAPHLPASLQVTVLQEALAAAQTIAFEDDRAQALAELAPHLPAPLLREALAVAQAIANKGARALALAGLAPHLPASLQVTVLQEALAAAQTVADEFRRARVLAELAPHLPAPLLQEALALAQTIAKWYDRAQALVGLAPHLPVPLLQEALATAADKGESAKVLARLVSRLGELGYGEDALAVAQATADEGDRAQVLAELAPHLPASLLQEVLVTAQAIADEGDRAPVLTRLVPRLGELGYGEDALAVAQTIAFEDDRAQALVGLAPHLPAPLLQEALATAQAIANEYLRADVLAGLAPYVKQLPVVRLYALWDETIRILATRTRRDLLSDIQALAPIIVALGGKEALIATALAIIEVGKWFS